MPVFHRVVEGVLLVTVDGDFTADEIVRVGGRALDAPDLIQPAFVILDLSNSFIFKHRAPPAASVSRIRHRAQR